MLLAIVWLLVSIVLTLMILTLKCLRMLLWRGGCGPHYQKLPRPAVSFYTVDARKGAEDNASVHSSALHFATVVDFALGAII